MSVLVQNKNYLEKTINNKYIKDIENPEISEIISILENKDLKKVFGHIYIYALQSALSILGYGEDLGKIDGWMGKKTRGALKKFKKDNPEGEIFEAIIKKLKEIS